MKAQSCAHTCWINRSIGFTVTDLRPETTSAIHQLIDGVSAIILIARWGREFKMDEFFVLIRFAKSLFSAAHSHDESAVAFCEYVWFSSARVRD